MVIMPRVAMNGGIRNDRDQASVDGAEARPTPRAGQDGDERRQP